MANSKIKYITALFWVSLAFSAGWLSGAGIILNSHAASDDPYESLRILAQVLRTVEHNYIDEIPPETLIHGAIHGLVNELDSHSKYLAPEEFESIKTTATGWSIGVGIELNKEYLIVGISNGTPAAAAGLMVGDRILEVDEHVLKGQSLKLVKEYFDGEIGSEVHLKIERDQNIISITLSREDIKKVLAECDILPNSIILIRISEFGRGTSEQVKICIEQVQAQEPIKSIILDLRSNPGGLVEEGVKIVDLFVDDGLITAFYERGTETKEEYFASPNSPFSDYPIMTLINGQSASAAELSAGALQKLGRSLLIGQPSYGKGSMQKIYTFDGTAAIKLTVAHYKLPDGTIITREEPLIPDHNISNRMDSPKEELHTAITNLPLDESVKHTLLQRLDILNEPEIPSAIALHKVVEQRLDEDPQLRFAWNLLNAKN
jgi:carboxyl-terminal processing protease